MMNYFHDLSSDSQLRETLNPSFTEEEHFYPFWYIWCTVTFHLQVLDLLQETLRQFKF